MVCMGVNSKYDGFQTTDRVLGSDQGKEWKYLLIALGSFRLPSPQDLTWRDTRVGEDNEVVAIRLIVKWINKVVLAPRRIQSSAVWLFVFSF